METTEAIVSVGKELIMPMVKRLGLTVATILVTYGVAAEHADIVVNSLGAIGLVAVDTAVVLWKRKRRARLDL